MAARGQSVYAIVWRYRVRRGRERAFERAYGSRGVWARLFRKSRGYRGTGLYRDTGRPRTYVTVDLWVSRAAFRACQRRSHDEYARIDRRCASFTEMEKRIGAWTLRW
jgi:heme-degrading monooxygenase HmoA